MTNLHKCDVHPIGVKHSRDVVHETKSLPVVSASSNSVCVHTPCQLLDDINVCSTVSSCNQQVSDVGDDINCLQLAKLNYITLM